MSNFKYFILSIFPATVLGLLESYWIFTTLFDMWQIDYQKFGSGLDVALGIGFCLLLSAVASFLTWAFFSTMCTCLDEDQKERLQAKIIEQERVDKILNLYGDGDGQQ